MNIKKIESKSINIIQLMLLVVILALGGCTSNQKSTVGGKLKVVTTTGMIYDAVRNVAGDYVDVTALMGPGVDPHLYKATQGDLQKLTDANVILYNGLHLEGKMGEVFENLSRTKAVFAVSANIPDSLLRTVPGFENTHDPHIWFDVALWKEAVKTISRTLQEQDTLHKEIYQKNTISYLSKLDSLHETVKQRISSIPLQQRVLITAHDAFGYFGDAYSIEVRGLQGISTMSEFGVRDVSDLVTFIVDRKIKAIFVETSVSHKSIEAVIESCKEKGWNVNIGGSLYSDAMGEAGTSAGTYIGMVDANVTTIVNALQ